MRISDHLDVSAAEFLVTMAKVPSLFPLIQLFHGFKGFWRSDTESPSSHLGPDLQ